MTQEFDEKQNAVVEGRTTAEFMRGIPAPFSRVKDSPEMLDRDSRTIAKGEVTGHAHVLARTPVERLGGTLVRFEIVHPEGDVLTHEEHDPRPLSPGKMRADVAREYHHLEEEVRPVAD
jgi:hypothetical protein